MKKLVNLRIAHIAGVDHPANQRKFLVIKSADHDEQPVEFDGTYEGVLKHFGSYQAYRQASYAGREPVEKSAAPIELAKLSTAALTEYFERNPNAYVQYRLSAIATR